MNIICNQLVIHFIIYMYNQCTHATQTLQYELSFTFMKLTNLWYYHIHVK